MNSEQAIAELPIGVFDSGMGGLTVLAALARQLPLERFVYLGDTARLPYGTKSATTVCRYAQQAADLLLAQRVKALVVACNTASAYALPHLAAQYAPLPVYGVVEPGAAAAVATSAGRVGVVATESTIAAGAYQRALMQHRTDLQIFGRACPLWVTLAEQDGYADAVVHAVLADGLRGLLETAQIDTLLLGCTHFPVFAQRLQALVGPNIAVVDSAATTAAVVAADLRQRKLASTALDQPQFQFFATDGAARFQRIGTRFLGAPIDRVTLLDLGPHS